MSGASLAARLRAGDSLLVGWVGLPEPLVAELVARAGFDCVCLEGQHALVTPDAVMRGITAVAFAGKPAIVRVPVEDFAFASHALDMGAEAIIAPMINTPEDARRLVAATKYPPLGQRSWGPLRAMTLNGNDPAAQLANANDDTLALAMIETAEAIANLDAILEVDGIDGVFAGPSDLSVSLSDGRTINPVDPALDPVFEDICARATRAGKLASGFAMTPQRAADMRAMGFRLVALGNDQLYLASGIKAMIGEVG